MKAKKDLRIVYLSFGILILLVVAALVGYGITAYIITRPIELSGSIDCSSGKIGIDYESVYNFTRQDVNAIDEIYLGNLSSKTTMNITSEYKDGKLVPKKFNIKGIDNLNCKITFDSKSQLSNLIIFAKAIEALG